MHYASVLLGEKGGDYSKMKLKQLASFIPALTLVAVVLATVIVFGAPADPLLPAYIEVFVVNTDPVPVALDGPINVTLDEPINVTLDEPIEVTVTDGVTLAEDSEVKTIAKTKVFIPFDHVILPAAPSPTAPSWSIAYINVDGYKTINIWKRGINGWSTFCVPQWEFQAAGEIFTGNLPDIADVWESQSTHEVRAWRLGIIIKNYDNLAPSLPITVVVYAIS